MKIKKLLKSKLLYILFSLIIIDNCFSVENKILFKVNNEIITSLDIFTEMKYLSIINDEFRNIDKEKAFEISKNSLIREKIKEVEIKKFIDEIKIKDDVLNNIILSYFKDFKVKSINEFEKYFLKLSIDPNLIRKKMTIEVLWNQLIFNKFNQSIKIDKTLIKNNLSNNNKQTEFLVSEILFNIDKGENLNEKFDLIEDSIKKINFSQTATIFSTSNTANKGGKLDWISETALSEMIYKKLKELTIGEHTQPILVPGGFLVLKLLDLREATKDFNLNQEVAKIVKKKTNQQLNQFSNIYFNKVKKDLVIEEVKHKSVINK